MKKPRAIASSAGAVAPLEFCHADSTGAGIAARILNLVQVGVK